MPWMQRESSPWIGVFLPEETDDLLDCVQVRCEACGKTLTLNVQGLDEAESAKFVVSVMDNHRNCASMVH